MEKNEKDDDDDDLGEFMLADEPLERVVSDDNMSEVGGYCPSEVPEEDFFDSSPSSDHSDLAETKKTPRQVFAAKNQKSLRSKTEFTDAEVSGIVASVLKSLP
jgi:hypothetical protein